MPTEKTAKPALTEDPATEKHISSEEFSEKESVLTGRVFNLETKIEHTVDKDYLEKAIGDMKEGIAIAVGEMKTSVAEIKWEIIKWILGGTTTLITLGLIVYRLFFFNPPTN